MKKVIALFLFVGICLTLTACGSSSADVPSLAPTPMPETADDLLSNEEMMMAFTACLREQGLDVADPVMDAEGNIGKPEIPEGPDKNEFGEVWEACEFYLEGFSYEKKRTDRAEELEQYLDLAACLREEGIDIGDPTAENLDTWMENFKTNIDFGDTDSLAAFENCTDGAFRSEGGKGK